VRALGIITMLLMQKYHSDNGDLGIKDTQRWPLDSDAVQFLTETSAAKPVQVLMKVRYGFLPWGIAYNLYSIHY
jgi:hypothetical protein